MITLSQNLNASPFPSIFLFTIIACGIQVCVCVRVCVHAHAHRHLCAYAFDLSRGQDPGGLIQRLKFCWEGNEDLKDTPLRRLQITAFSR